MGCSFILRRDHKRDYVTSSLLTFLRDNSRYLAILCNLRGYGFFKGSCKGLEKRVVAPDFSQTVEPGKLHNLDALSFRP